MSANPGRASGAMGRAAAYAALLVISYVICFPLIWAMSTSVKPPAELSAMPPHVVPESVTLENYRHLITGKQQYFEAGEGTYRASSAPPQHFMSWFLNSCIVSGGSTLISIVVSTLAAYSVTRFRYRGRTLVPYFSLLGYMVPSIILVFPLFLVMSRLGLTDSLWSLVLGYVSVTLPFCMWLLWAFFRGSRSSSRKRRSWTARAACASSSRSCCPPRSPGSSPRRSSRSSCRGTTSSSRACS